MQSSTTTNGHNRVDTESTVFDGNGISGLPASPQGSSFMPSTVNGSAAPTVIPPEHPFRTLVLAFDGTGDQFDNDNSNIVQLFSMLLKGDRTRQMVYYQAGIGTYTTPQIATPFFSKISKFIDEAIAWNLDAHVMGGYEFLMQNYTTNDRICIFGFSRGAYTARSLAGMIHKVGLLPSDNHQQIPFAYKMYSDETEVGWAQSNAFKKAFSIDVDIEFVGVWDTVNSVGLIPRRLPFTTSNTIVWFSGCHCDVGGGSVDNETVHNLARIPLRWMIRECFKTNSGIMFDCEGLRSIGLDPGHLYPTVVSRPPPLPVGNLHIRSIPSSKEQSEAQKEAALTNFANSEAAQVTQKTEEELELQDALCPIYDQLNLAWFWWILEFLPLKQRYQAGDNRWVEYFGWNMGRGRFIPKQKTNGIRVHRSVKMRLEAQTESGGKYKPKAAFDLARTTWVD
ncbi:DUF2235 domain-containing protein [Mycena venus]|uniref:DUF2235 domain-containing protein n=1 Tax=Mycena venus TaxID=2733690 RepID=A0A8H6Y788_9AGAR|nr:DUF2235 domain-containing protein [Mycena venus]